MIRVGYIILVLLFILVMGCLFALVLPLKEYTNKSHEHQQALLRASLLESSDPEGAEALRQKAAQLEKRLTAIARTRETGRKVMKYALIALALLSLVLAVATPLSCYRAKDQSTPVTARVLDVRKTGRMRNGCPQVVVQVQIERSGSDSPAEASTKVYLCDEVPETRDGMTAIRADRIQPGMRIPARYSPAFGGAVRLVADDFE
jgi:hypothetical protein